MAAITSTGIGSGLDVNALVTQLVAAERAPADKRLTQTDAKLTTELTALSRLKAAMAAFQGSLAGLKTASALNVRTAKVSDELALTAAATSSAAPGIYDVEIQQLATAARLGSQLFAGGANSTVGTGTLTVAVGDDSFDIEIDTENSSLADIRDAINNAADNSGVRATLIRDTTGTGSYLVLSGARTGEGNAITVSSTGADAGLDAFVLALNDVDALRDVPAQDAIINVSGYEIRSESNTVTGAIDGVTLNLRAAEVGKLVSLEVARDDAAIRTRVQTFVTSYNALATQVKSLGAYDAATKTAGPMIGDSMLRGIDTQLRRLISDPVAGTNGNYTTLSSLGVAMTVGGALELDAAKLDAALAADGEAVSKLFAAESGIATRIGQFLDRKLGAGGEISSRDTFIATRRENLEKQQEALNARMQVVEARYLKQFTALDSMLSQLQSTSTYLTQQLDSLSNLASRKN